MANSTIPTSISDVLLHAKTSESVEKVILPITRYDNVLNSPRVVQNGSNIGAPFVLLQTDEEVLSVSEIRSLCGGII